MNKVNCFLFYNTLNALLNFFDMQSCAIFLFFPFCLPCLVYYRDLTCLTDEHIDLGLETM